MELSDKLNFLIHVAQISNKELAAELCVDRSFISLLRNGKRQLRNQQTIKKMALFFARHCTTEFQRYALAEMLGQVSLRSDMPAEVLASRLEQWLTGDIDIVGEIAEGITHTPQKLPLEPEAPVTLQSENQTEFFYGEDGRRNAMYRMMQMMQEMETPTSILIATDDHLEWLLSDYVMTNHLQRELLKAIQRGFTFYQILPPMNYINRYTDSLRFWLPLYSTGQMKVYYYPRLRDNLYRHSIIIVPGRYVQFSASIAPGSTSDVTMLSTDPALIDAYTRQYQHHLSLCRPALNVYKKTSEAVSLFRSMFSSCEGEVIQQINTLAINTAPEELLQRCIQESDNSGWKATYRLYLEEIPKFEQKLRTESFIDMSYLASADEVRSGTLPIIATSDPENAGTLFYTPETYVLHLKNILRLMEEYENYYFIPFHEIKQDYNLIVNENGIAVMVHTAEPILTLEIRREEMVLAFREHLLRIAEKTGYNGIQQKKIRMELKALIRELQS